MFYPGGWFTYSRLLDEAAPKFAEIANEYILGGKKLDITRDEWLKECIHRYMDTIIDIYGIDHIILNRVYLNCYVLGEDKQVCGFKEDSSKWEILGGHLDNQRVHDIEEYVLENYPIHCLDISKYFTADWEHGHDCFPVHYEREYYEYADRALKKIVDGEAYSIDTLDELAFAYKLDKDVTMPDGTDNWKEYISMASNYFQVNPLMDELIENFSFDTVHRFRHELAATYRLLYNEKEYFGDASIPDEIKQEKLADYFEGLITK